MTKLAKIADSNNGANLLEQFLDALRGANRPSQIPGHFGNGPKGK